MGSVEAMLMAIAVPARLVQRLCGDLISMSCIGIAMLYSTLEVAYADGEENSRGERRRKAHPILQTSSPTQNSLPKRSHPAPTLHSILLPPSH
jgi:hypothetical protein